MTSRIAGLRFVAIMSFLCLARGAAAAQPVPIPSVQPSLVPDTSPAPALPPAGVIPAHVSITLTGAPLADTDFAYRQILSALERKITPTLRPGASISYGTVNPWPLLPLALGSPMAVDISVTIAGDDASAAVSGTVTVTLQSVSVPAVNPAVLFLSDDPEYLREEGLVFRNNVESGRTARLYYYHSDIGLPRDVDVVLTAAVPTRVQLIESGSGPAQDVMAVGHAVTRDFLQFERANEGVVVDIVPGEPYVARHALLLQGELIAGALDVQVLGGGGPVAVSVVASAAGGRADTYLAGPRVPFDGHHRHGAFDLAGYGTVAASYSVGGPAIAAQIGAKAPSPRNLDPKDDGRDYGDYGIIRTLTFTLANPTADAHRIYLYEKPLAGSVSSSFVVDGQLKELDCVRSRQPYTVMTYELPPHSTGATTTVTMTDGGSYYPLEFGVTDAQPNPYTPTVGSPDSCSPNVAAASQLPQSPAAQNPTPTAVPQPTPLATPNAPIPTTNEK